MAWEVVVGNVLSFVAPLVLGKVKEVAIEVANSRIRQLKKYYQQQSIILIFIVLLLIIAPFFYDIYDNLITQKLQTGNKPIFFELLYEYLILILIFVFLVYISRNLNTSGKILVGIFLIKTILFSFPLFQFYINLQTSHFQSTSFHSLHLIMICILLKFCLNFNFIPHLPSPIKPIYLNAFLTFILYLLTPGNKFTPLLRSIGEIAIIFLFEKEFTITGCVNFLVYLGISSDNQSLNLAQLISQSMEKVKSLMGFMMNGQMIPDLYSVIILRLIRSAIVGWIAYLIYVVVNEKDANYLCVEFGF